MSVLIQQATTRQLKALAKRLQTVISAELNTGPLALHQAQAILAKGLGHADFHAATLFHRAPKPTRAFTTVFAPASVNIVQDDAISGPPEHIVEVLMQRLSLFHWPDWPHWISRRALINAAVHDAWRHTDGASLTMARIKEACDLNSLMVNAQHHREPRAYMEGLQHVGGTDPLAPLDTLAKKHHAANVADWDAVFSQVPAPETPEEGIQRLFKRQYPFSVDISSLYANHSDHLEGILCADFQQIVRPWERSAYPPIVLNEWPRRLLRTLMKGLHERVPHLSKAHLLDAMAMDHLEVLAGPTSPFPPALRDEVAMYLEALSGERGGSLAPQNAPSIQREQHRHVMKAWAKVLQPEAYCWL